MTTLKASQSGRLEPLTPKEQATIKGRIARQHKMISQEWLGLSELGVYFGWEAVRDVINDVITLEQADMFVTGARKVHSTHVYDFAVASLAARSTKQGGFENLIKPYTDDMKAVE